MFRYFVHLAYNGYSFAGWQRQPNALSIQEVLEDRLSGFLKHPTKIHGCGRTDAMVHASQYFFHFDSKNELDPIFTVDILNRMLPREICVYDVIPVPKDAQSQFDATERTYNYFIHFHPSAFLHTQSAFYPIEKLNFDEMKKAIEVLPEYHNYSGLCKTPERHTTTLCDIKQVQLFTNKNYGRFRIEITSNRFLRGMIRIIVGKLLEIGKGNLSVEAFEQGIAKKITPEYLNLAYPQGLYLSKITYPYLDLPTHWDEVPVYESCEWKRI